MKSFSITTQPLVGGLVGLTLTGFDASGVVIKRNSKVLRADALDAGLVEIRAALAALNISEVSL